MEVEDDERFKALTSKQAKSAFAKYQESKLHEEKTAVLSKTSEALSAFRSLMQEAAVTKDTTWMEFKTQWQGDARFKAVAKEKDREAAFRSFVQDLHDKERQRSKEEDKLKFVHSQTQG